MQMRDTYDEDEELSELDASTATVSNEAIVTHHISPQNIGQRLDVFVTAALGSASRAEAQRLIEMAGTEAEGVRVNGKPEKSNYRLRVGDVITIEPPQPKTARIEAESIPLEIVYEDTDVLVINKARGMVVHPAPGAMQGTLVNAVLGYATDLSGIGGEQRPGIVHRLDKDTGGLIMVAKNDLAHRDLQAQIQARTAKRRYQALVWGVPAFERATIDAPIGRHPSDRKKMAVLTDARHTARTAQTELQRLETFASAFAFLEATLRTGRTHQIRVHCAYIHHPIVGDPLYGGLRKLGADVFPSSVRAQLEADIANLGGQALHAYALSFSQPRTGVRLDFQVPLPSTMQILLDHLRAATNAFRD